MVVKLVCSRVCCATEGTSRTPASHFFLSPPEDGGFSGEIKEAKKKMVVSILFFRGASVLSKVLARQIYVNRQLPEDN